jgi:phage tail sheath protein FI
MAVEYYTPGVYVEEVSSGSKSVTAVPTSIVGFIGEAKSGISNSAKLVTTWDQYFNEFVGYTKQDKKTPRGTVEKDADGKTVQELVPNPKTTDLDWAVYGFFANGGSKCYIVSVDGGQTQAVKQKTDKKDSDEKGAKATASSTGIATLIIGNDGGPGKRTGINCFKEVDEVSLVCAPGCTDASVQQEILTYCEANNIFAILDAPKTLEELSSFGLDTDLNGLSGLSAKCASKQAALYFPWVNVYDPEKKEDIAVAPSGFVAGIYSRVDTQRGVHKAPANEPVRLVKSLMYTLSDTEQETLNQKGVNCIRDFSDMGIRVWGARTTICDIDPEWRYINVRRLFNMVEKSVKTGSKWAVFEPNDSFLWIKLKRNITAFLTRIYNSGALAGANASEAFFVKCDATNNPQENIDAGIVTVEVGIAVVKPAEFIVFKISQKDPGAEGEDEGAEEESAE